MLNPDTGELTAIKNSLEKAIAEENKWPVFKVGEKIVIKGHTFKLQYIHAKQNQLVFVSTMLKRKL